MDQHKERRRHPRFSLSSCPLRVYWQDEHGRFRQMPGRGIDLSRSGIGIELPEPIQLGAQVNISMDRFDLTETAGVRHCRRVGPRYHIGLEFTMGLRWNHPELLRLEQAHVAGV
ncbi:MAG: PilZ domain-containing protein [Acidobacteria bacterium]|nr:PilZ domain-containing protein [Acidobacteriota bacterium]